MAVYRLGPIDLSTKPLGQAFSLASGEFTAPCWILLYNESPYLLNIDLPDGNGEQLNPFLADWFYVAGNNVQVTPIAFLNLANPPSTQLLPRVYTNSPPKGSYPLDLSRSTVIGGNSLAVNQLINDGAIAGATLIEASVSGVQHRLDTVDGDITLKKDTTAANQPMLILVDLKAGGKGWTEYLMSDGSLLWQETTGGVFNMQLYPDGHFVAHNWSTTAAGGATFNGNLTAPKMVASPTGFQGASGGTISAFSLFSGVGDVTVAHGLGTTPTLILAMQNVAGSQTMGVNTVGATNCTIKTGAGLAWWAIAMKIV